MDVPTAIGAKSPRGCECEPWSARLNPAQQGSRCSRASRHIVVNFGFAGLSCTDPFVTASASAKRFFTHLCSGCSLQGLSSAVSPTFRPNVSRLILARWQGQAILLVSFVSSHMIGISLGQRIHELRDKADLSLRGLAKRIGISSPFLSDIELGRRFPSEEILAKLAGALEVSPDELKQYDTRAPIADLKRLMDSDPKLGFAFRTVVEKVKNGELTAEDIIVKLSKRKSRA